MAKVLTKRVWNEIFFVVFMIILSRLTEYFEPLIFRKIHDEEIWLYKNPRTPSYVPSVYNWIICTIFSVGVFCIVYLFKKNIQDLIEATLGVAFSAGLTGTITNVIKNVACRPRPDFFERCFPDGIYKDGMPESCTGDPATIIEGLKSFPSGHSSLAFASLGFSSLYLAGKLQCFNTKGRQPWRLVVAIQPLLLAAVTAVSRTADYHHHWQDVLVGSCLGMLIAYVAYRQRFPPLTRTTCHLPYVMTSVLDLHHQDPQQVVTSPLPYTPTQPYTSTDTESVMKTV